MFSQNARMNELYELGKPLELLRTLLFMAFCRVFVTHMVSLNS